MPREIYLLTPVPVVIEALLAAAAEVDDQLGVRALYDGAALQLVGDDGDAVLTVQGSRLLQDSADVARVTRGLEVPAGQVWWAEATAPWGPSGLTGVVIARGLAAVLRGAVRVEDGT